MAWRMSGGLAWAIVEPSTRVTIECTIDCGWTTTWTRSSGRSNWKQASMTSRALLTRVAELVVITRPIDHVGWASACSGVTCRELLTAATTEGAAGGGDHQVVDLLVLHPCQRLRDRGVLGVHRQDLPGSCRFGDQVAADDQ